MAPSGSNVKSYRSMKREDIPRIKPVRAQIVPSVSRKRMAFLLTPPFPEVPPSYFRQMFFLRKQKNAFRRKGTLWYEFTKMLKAVTSIITKIIHSQRWHAIIFVSWKKKKQGSKRILIKCFHLKNIIQLCIYVTHLNIFQITSKLCVMTIASSISWTSNKSLALHVMAYGAKNFIVNGIASWKSTKQDIFVQYVTLERRSMIYVRADILSSSIADDPNNSRKESSCFARFSKSSLFKVSCGSNPIVVPFNPSLLAANSV